jgi:hypothetical protein
LADVAIITNSRNESVTLPRCVACYGGQFGARNLFVLDDIIELEAGYFVRSRPMDRTPTIYRIPERFLGMV